MKKQWLGAVAVSVAITAVSVLPAMAATSAPTVSPQDGWILPPWEGQFHNAHSLHTHATQNHHVKNLNLTV